MTQLSPILDYLVFSFDGDELLNENLYTALESLGVDTNVTGAKISHSGTWSFHGCYLGLTDGEKFLTLLKEADRDFPGIYVCSIRERFDTTSIVYPHTNWSLKKDALAYARDEIALLGTTPQQSRSQSATAQSMATTA